MELQVTITLSDRLFSLLEDKLPNLGRRVEKAITKELSAQARRESTIAVDVTAIGAKTDTPEVENPEPQAPAMTSEETGNPEPQAQVGTSEPETITPEIARKHLTQTRRRLLGENYEAQKGSTPYKAITALAKQIILHVSGHRVETIPGLTDEERKRFMKECDELIIGEDGLPSFPRAPF